MPIETNFKKSGKHRMSGRRGRDADFSYPRMSESESILPDALRSKLWKLFSQIEAEFEGVYAENLNCEWECIFFNP